MSESPVNRYLRTMSDITVRLVRNAHTFPTDSGIASGLLLETGTPDELLLLTAGHIFEREGTWTMETSVVVERRTIHAMVRDVQRFLSVDTQAGDSDPVDIAWGRVLCEDVREGMRAAGLGGKATQLSIYRGPRDVVPNEEDLYGFATFTQPMFHEDIGKLERLPCYEVGLTYSHSLPDGTYVFDLARPHQGHEYYDGASGSPVSASDGTIVGILISGDPDTNSLFVTPLSRYAPLFNIKTPPDDVP